MIEPVFQLNGKHALVTGASGGLGQQFARTLHAAGASVVLTGRDPSHPVLQQLMTELAPRCSLLTLDVQDERSINAVFDQLQKQQLVVDILINNAGIAVGTSALETETEAFDAIWNTNLRGPWLLARQFAKALQSVGKGGSLVNVCSILGSRVASGVMPYAAAKAGLVHMTRALALEWARYEIRVNSLSPGFIETNINREYFKTDAATAMLKRIPQRRIGQPADLDGALLLLVSDASRYMTGSDIVVDGGHLCGSL